MNYVIYLQKGDLGDATSFYVETVQEVIVRNGDTYRQTQDCRSILPDDTVLVIQAKAFFRLWLRNRKQKILMWFQGVVPEESQMIFAGKISRFPRKWLWRFLERVALKRAFFILFVSHAMVEHYRKQYGYNKQNYLIMPCFNLMLDKTAFYVEGKYTTPNFVYAGGLSTWQCLRQTLELFKAIESRIPGATLTILTAQQDLARQMIDDHGIGHYRIKYIPSCDVGAELANYKYGFLLREDNVVNNVATPTKMNSYMAAGIIPIYTDVIGDFKSVFAPMRYVVRLESLNETRQNLEQIIRFQEQQIDPNVLRAEYESCFASYYNRERYIEQLQEILSKQIGASKK